MESPFFSLPNPTYISAIRNVFLHSMAYNNTKEEKLAFFKKFMGALNSKDESLLDDCFAQDFKMTVPGTGGREANDIPLPPGIAGSFLIKSRLNSK